ncbi:MAG: 5-bromo-4-chloroindolyl phosphate hydrolysis family protein [Albidovulum sp.]
MAERFGGQYSPSKGDAPAPHTPRSRAERRTGLMFLLALPFAVKAFWHDPMGLALNLGAFGALVLAAWLTREGVRAAEAYHVRNTARRPALPRKILGAAATVLGLGLGAYPDGGMAVAAGLGLIGGGLHLMAFGADPMRDKGMENVDTFQQDRAARIVAEGEAYLDAMQAAAARTADRQIVARVARFAITARDLFRTVEEDPRDLTAARRYLGVYLMGARDATIKFAEFWTRKKDPQARADYEALLEDLEQNFANRTTALLSDNRNDLDIEIGVLRDRLKREGVRIDP